MNSLKCLKRTAVIAMCLAIILTLCSCGPSLEYQILESLGYYPDEDDFPNTKWVCREADLTFYMLDYGESTLIGEYRKDGKTYCVVGEIWFGEFNFTFYDSVDNANSSYTDKNGVNYRSFNEAQDAGGIRSQYIYKDGVIQCTVEGSINFDSGIKTLTFENAGQVSDKPECRWRCQEVDMYIDSFEDNGSYFKGKATINGKSCNIQAFKITNDGFYRFTVENQGLNTALKTSNFIDMYLEIHEDVIIAGIADSYLLEPKMYEYWNYNVATVTFKREEIK